MLVSIYLNITYSTYLIHVYSIKHEVIQRAINMYKSIGTPDFLNVTGEAY